MSRADIEEQRRAARDQMAREDVERGTVKLSDNYTMDDHKRRIAGAFERQDRIHDNEGGR